MTRRIMLITALTLGCAAAQTRAADSTLRLRPHVVAGAPLRLADVLDMSGADADLIRRIADEPLLTDAAAALPTHVSAAEVAARLRALDVNMTRVLLSGAARCVLAPPTSAATSPQAAAADDAPPSETLALAGRHASGTLADALRQFVARELHDLDGRPELVFEKSAADLLDLQAPPFEFIVRNADRNRLGPREFTVVIRRDGRTHRQVRIAARVALLRDVLVAARPLNAGAAVRVDDVRLEKRQFERDGDFGLTRVGDVVGHQVERFTPVGEMVTSAAIRTTPLVKRNQPVTVISTAGGVALRLSGTALSNGRMGEMVRVRLGATRGERRIVEGAVSAFGVVQLQDAPADAPTAAARHLSRR